MDWSGTGAFQETDILGACVAIFVNPSDKRYQKIVGKMAKVPIFNNEVPIIPDKSAEIEKGTGALMICSYGDKYDVDAIKRMVGKNSKYMLDAGTTATSKLGSVLTDMMRIGLLEGTDEMTMDIFQNEGKYQHDVEKGLVKETTFTERLSKHLGDKKSWDVLS